MCIIFFIPDDKRVLYNDRRIKLVYQNLQIVLKD